MSEKFKDPAHDDSGRNIEKELDEEKEKIDELSAKEISAIR